MVYFLKSYTCFVFSVRPLLVTVIAFK